MFHGQETLKSRPTLLVVEDDARLRETLGLSFTAQGFAVRTAGDGVAALKELSRTPCDAVLTDLKMPNMGGLELLEAIQKAWPHTVTVIMTGFSTVDTALRAMKQGAHDYVLKPFQLDEVVHTLRSGLKKQRRVTAGTKLKETLSLYKVSEAISASASLDVVMGRLVDTVLRELSADRVEVWLDDGEGGLFERSAQCRDANPLVVGSENAHQSRVSAGILAPEQVLACCDGTQPLWKFHGSQALTLLRQAPSHAVSQLLVAPLRVLGRTIGFVAAANFKGNQGDPWLADEAQAKLFVLAAERAAAALENAELHEHLRATLSQTILGLAAVIDKTDRYTAGHSLRVAAFAQVLAIKLGLPPAQVEVVRQAALMHDVGKIGCVMNLNKSGSLAEHEYAVFKQHPDIGKEILEPFEFLKPVIPGVYHHHERWDGHGYPAGLKAQQIPLIARIVSLADVYDAMTSDRAYRRALPHGVAVAEIERCAGGQFDPDMVGDFIAAVEAKRQDGYLTAGEAGAAADLAGTKPGLSNDL